MAKATDIALAEYARSQNVTDRNFSTLLGWAGYIGSFPIGEAPKGEDGRPQPDWVRLRIVAERIPSNTQQYVTRTMSFFMQDPAIGERLSRWLARNDDDEERELSEANRRIVDGFMPRFALTDTNPSAVEQWLILNGFPAHETQ